MKGKTALNSARKLTFANIFTIYMAEMCQFICT